MTCLVSLHRTSQSFKWRSFPKNSASTTRALISLKFGQRKESAFCIWFFKMRSQDGEYLKTFWCSRQLRLLLLYMLHSWKKERSQLLSILMAMRKSTCYISINASLLCRSVHSDLCRLLRKMLLPPWSTRTQALNLTTLALTSKFPLYPFWTKSSLVPLVQRISLDLYSIT